MIIIISFANLFKCLKNHWPALVGALVCGVLFIAPQVVFRLQLGTDFKGVYLGGVDAEFYYMRIQEAYDGNLLLASSGLFEYKELPYSNPPLGELSAAGLGRLLGLSAPEAVVAGSFIFPTFLFLVFYTLFYSLTSKKLLSLTASAGILLASNFILFPGNILDLFVNPGEIKLNIYNRPIHPQVSSLYFFIWLLVFWSYLKNRSRKWLLYGSGVLFGFLFYVYPYSWMLAVVFQGLILFYFFWKKDWQRVKLLIFIGLIGIVVTIPYWLNFIELVSHPWYETLKKFQAFYHTREPVFSSFLVFDVILILLLRYWLKVKSKVILFSSIFAASLIILINQHVITNIRFFPGHWHWYYVTAFTIFLAVFTFWRIIEKWPRARTVVGVLIIGIFFVNGAVSQKNYYRDASPHSIAEQRFVPVYDWLNANAQPSSVVVAEEPLSTWIPFYTASNHYLTHFLDSLSLMPIERLRHDLFVKLYLQGAREENLDEFINQKMPEFYFVLFGFWRQQVYDCRQCFPVEEIEQFKEKYLGFLRSDFRDELNVYRADYLVFDAQGGWDVSNLDFLEAAVVLDDFIIYEVN